jgi:MATE family multidrug resistance protein
VERMDVADPQITQVGPDPLVGASADSAALSAQAPTPGGSRELLALAAPLVVSQGFMTVQVFVDTLLLAHHDQHEMAASFPAVMWYWLFLGFFQATAGYTSMFVAQYTGAKRPHRVGAAVWQGLHLALVTGLLFVAVIPAAPFLIGLAGHSAMLQVT